MWSLAGHPSTASPWTQTHIQPEEDMAPVREQCHSPSTTAQPQPHLSIEKLKIYVILSSRSGCSMQVTGMAASANHANFNHPTRRTRGDTVLTLRLLSLRAEEALDGTQSARLSNFM